MELSLKNIAPGNQQDWRDSILSANRKPGLCSVHMVDGTHMAGELMRIDGKRELLTLRDKTNKEPSEIGYRSIAYVRFEHLYSDSDIPQIQVTYADGAVVAPRSMPFNIIFNTGEKLAGLWKIKARKQRGLHLFTEKTAGRYERYFMPLRSIVSYDLEAAPGELLTPPAAAETPAQADKSDVVEFQSPLAPELTSKERLKKQQQYLKEFAADSSDKLRRMLDAPMPPVHQRMGEMLVEAGVITPEERDKALAAQKLNKKRIGEELIELGLALPDTVLLTIARSLQVPYVVLKDFDISTKALELVPPEVVTKYRALPLLVHNDALVVASSAPADHDLTNVLRFTSGKAISFVMTSEEDLDWAIEYCYREHEDEKLADELQLKVLDDSSDTINAEAVDEDQAPIIRLVTQIVSEGVKKGASDIHLWPAGDRFDLYYRIDGALVKIRRYSKRLLPAIVSRIKIIGRMDIAERRLPQDGRAQVILNEQKIDLRFSVVPTVAGESVVIRILNKDVGLRELSEIGFSKSHEEKFLDIINKSFGMFLVTGPTGSGKSTTLYSALNEVRKKNVNIITLEDPVEYRMEGVNQIQVNTAPGFDFARALKNVLRHDPDVVMVGEIRDYETAKIAVQSALTGHLVLSTLHTNDAAGAVTRLVEMGIEPYLVNSSLLGVLAQRLVKKNCPDCIDEEPIDALIRKSMGIPETEVFYRGKGCPNCNNTGYKGRRAVYELLVLSSKMRHLIIQGANNDELYKQAVEDGMIGLTENALELARNRETSLEEVYRVRVDRDTSF